MGLGLKLMILVIVLSFSFSLVVPEAGAGTATTIFSYFMNSNLSQNTDFTTFVLNGLFNSLNVETLIALLAITGVSVAAAVLLGGGNATLGAALTYIIPASLMMVLANMFLFPLGQLFNTANPLLPSPFNYLFIILMNVMMLASVVIFVSGRDW